MFSLLSLLITLVLNVSDHNVLATFSFDYTCFECQWSHYSRFFLFLLHFFWKNVIRSIILSLFLCLHVQCICMCYMSVESQCFLFFCSGFFFFFLEYIHHSGVSLTLCRQGLIYFTDRAHILVPWPGTFLSANSFICFVNVSLCLLTKTNVLLINWFNHSLTFNHHIPT